MTVKVLHGDSVALLAAESDPLFDACVTDPPYELGFMGKAWDASGVAFSVDTWRAVFDRLKPGAHLVAFGGTRTFHRLVVAIEDAGFEVRDMLLWHYGSGFPKSLNIAKALQAQAETGSSSPTAQRRAAMGEDYEQSPLAGTPGYGRTGNFSSKDTGSKELEITDPTAARWQGWGTALKPATEPICLARKPLIGTVAANVLAHGTGGLNIDACRIEADPNDVNRRDNAATDNGGGFGAGGEKAVGIFGGGGTQKQRAPTLQQGRFPANLLHDGSDEVLAGFPEAGGGHGGGQRLSRSEYRGGGQADGSTPHSFDDSGSAARFFYSAKAGPLDRIGSAHATIKPVDLMRWLVRLVTPPGGHVLDPFGGSGTTGIAALAEGLDATLIELEPEHVADIERKLAFLRGEGKSRVVEHLKRKVASSPIPSAGPLFD